MRKSFLLAASLLVGLALSSCPAAAQLVLEHRYNNHQINVARLSTGDWKYYGMNPLTNRLTVYNLNHSVDRQWVVPVPAGLTISSPYQLSDALFDTNPATYETLITGYSIPAGGGNPLYHILLVDDTGTLRMRLDTISSAYAVETSAGAKLIANGLFFNGVTTDYKGRVYGLPGHVSMGVADSDDSLGPAAERSAPWPNPAADAIRLPYRLAPGQTGTLVVQDATGREVRRYSVDGAFPDLLLTSHELAPGTYIYSVGANGQMTVGGRFVVAR